MISLVAAVDANMLIGSGEGLPWHYPEDLRYFRRLTLNHRVLMGRKTFYSILEKTGGPLPGRTNIVASRDKNFYYPGIIIVSDIDAFLSTPYEDEVFVIGGREIYKAALPYTDRLYLTHIDKKHKGDVYFPAFCYEDFRLIERQYKGNLSFCVYERIKI